jgi:predicted transcriptional regulator
MGRTKKASLYAEIKEGLEEMVAIENGQKKPVCVHESKMLDKVRGWRKKAYDADKAKLPAQRTEEAERAARKLDLPLDQPRRADSDCP